MPADAPRYRGRWSPAMPSIGRCASRQHDDILPMASSVPDAMQYLFHLARGRSLAASVVARSLASAGVTAAQLPTHSTRRGHRSHDVDLPDISRRPTHGDHGHDGQRRDRRFHSTSGHERGGRGRGPRWNLSGHRSRRRDSGHGPTASRATWRRQTICTGVQDGRLVHRAITHGTGKQKMTRTARWDSHRPDETTAPQLARPPDPWDADHQGPDLSKEISHAGLMPGLIPVHADRSVQKHLNLTKSRFSVSMPRN